MNRTEAVLRAIRRELQAMEEFDAPGPLLEGVRGLLRRFGFDDGVEEADLVEALRENYDSGDVVFFHTSLAAWDRREDLSTAWTGGTRPATKDRRRAVLKALGFSESAAESFDEFMPPELAKDVSVLAPDWNPWYTADRRRNSFYWEAYRKVLERRMGPEAVASIDVATTDIVGRLADPASETPYQSKGLVVGHVQSGKTANFTGVIAKAIDAGYRLVIVLTGTVEILRTQTQRRLDMELIGRENILGGVDPEDRRLCADVDYAGDGDHDWFEGRFVEHGDPVASGRVPRINRLTGRTVDYKNLRHGLSALDFRAGNELKRPDRPVWDPENLYATDIRIAVIKKNKIVMKRLVDDIQRIHARADEIPVLIIDDEADQASVNTTRPDRTGEERERSAINGLLSEFMRKMSRSQYIGYTATPFANVFISPNDAEDLFPKDFIVSLEPPKDYMGGRSFHDLDGLEEDQLEDPGVSNRAAFVRDLRGDGDADLVDALDAFVLSGAVKKWRAARDGALSFRHHTMLVHETVRIDDHRELADRIRRLWRENGYGTGAPEAKVRLRRLFEEDFLRVSGSRNSWEAPMPEAFEELWSGVGEAVDEIMRRQDPVVVVNGEKAKDYDQVDFDSEPVWRILVGGQKLSRGYTIEGLTTTYYRRRSSAADSLMQMGRWFGYRRGYADLVRLFIDREAKDSRGRSYDLYEAFQAVVEDEEAFREQLAEFAELDEDGRPRVRPAEVPPLVFQQLPWLRPTGATKMYNAQIDFMGSGGRLQDFPRQPERGDGTRNREHFAAVSPWLDRLGKPLEFEYRDVTGDRRGTFLARVAEAGADEVLAALRRFHWLEEYDFSPTLRMLEKAQAEGKLDDWAVVVPYLGAHGPVVRRVDGRKVPILKRSRRTDRGGFSGSSFRQRDAVQHIAGGRGHGGPNADRLHRQGRGAMLLTFAADPNGGSRAPKDLPEETDARDVATLFSLVLPKEAAPRGRIGFRVVDASSPESVVVPRRD